MTWKPNISTAKEAKEGHHKKAAALLLEMVSAYGLIVAVWELDSGIRY